MSNAAGAVRDLRARREGATRANADREGGAQGQEGMGRTKGIAGKRKGGGRPRSLRCRRCAAFSPAST